MSNTPRNVTSVSNVELYDRWAEVYDTDGNVLQAIDDQEVPLLLHQLLNHVSPPTALKAIDLGCGTGRNTIKLLQPPFASSFTSILGLDASPGMLSLASRRCADLPLSGTPQLSLSVFDVLDPTSLPAAARDADVVVATLVLEHVPLEAFFKLVRGVLKVGGVLLLTNMHEEMGRRSQAGFVDGETGEKVRGVSWAYVVEEVVGAAGRCGFEVLGEVKERGVEEGDLEVVGGRGRKWLGTKIWFGGLMRLNSGV